jgi:hypothetical protein
LSPALRRWRTVPHPSPQCHRNLTVALHCGRAASDPALHTLATQLGRGMRTRTHALTLAGLLVAAGCGSGGGGTGGSNGTSPRPSTGDLALIEHAPALDAVQVALDAAVWLRFDGVLVRECCTDENLYLKTSTGEVAPGGFTFDATGREVRFTPTAPLRAETDYVFTLSPFLCDTNGRILAEQVELSFRTLDQRAPLLTAASVTDNQSGVDRLANLALTFDEALDPSSLLDTNVYLRDVYGGSYPCALALVDGLRVVVDPLADLAGDRRYRLVVAGGTRGITDRAGNVLAQGWSASFRTAPDAAPPRLTTVWPNAQVAISAHAQPEISFDESVDPDSVEPGSVTLTDEHHNVHQVRVVATNDQRKLRLLPKAPLPKGVAVRLAVAGGAGALTDVSGNALSTGSTMQWTVGQDDVAPLVASTTPAHDATRVSLNVRPRVVFDEALDADALAGGNVTLRDSRDVVSANAALVDGGTTLEVSPTANLRRNQSYTLTVRGGPSGLRDRAGNALAADVVVAFRTADDATLPNVILLPADGAAAVPTTSHISAVFDAVLDRATVQTGTLVVTTRAGTPVVGTVSLLRGDRALRFVPRDPWTPGAWYRVTLRGGPAGVRELSGNWLAADEGHDFRIGFNPDTQRPSVRVSLNAAADARRDNMQVPQSGFTVDVYAQDPVDYALDPTSFEVELVGSSGPGSDTIFGQAEVARDHLRWTVPIAAGLSPGTYQLNARARDLSGNEGTAATISFTVVEPAANRVPFERTHVVWVRTDLDRDGNGRGDFLDDLIKLGLCAEGDPAGLNERMHAILRDGVLSQAHQLYARAPSGAARSDGSVAIRFTHRRPLGVAHMQIALGGLDPEGRARRDYGDDSTGVLGRAYYDQYNGQTNDLNIATNPGLGVFGGELFLFQAQIHRRVWPAFVTSFARRFLNLAPGMNGTPVGRGGHDAAVVAAGFDYARATSEQRARYDQIFRAADDWATAIGVILAHEVGHAVGLVAEGPSPIGLHGDASLHDEGAGIADVMSPAVGYDALITLDYAFRDLDLAYLRQRLVLR